MGCNELKEQPAQSAKFHIIYLIGHDYSPVPPLTDAYLSSQAVDTLPPLQSCECVLSKSFASKPTTDSVHRVKVESSHA